MRFAMGHRATIRAGVPSSRGNVDIRVRRRSSEPTYIIVGIPYPESILGPELDGRKDVQRKEVKIASEDDPD